MSHFSMSNTKKCSCEHPTDVPMNTFLRGKFQDYQIKYDLPFIFPGIEGDFEFDSSEILYPQDTN